MFTSIFFLLQLFKEKTTETHNHRVGKEKGLTLQEWKYNSFYFWKVTLRSLSSHSNLSGWQITKLKHHSNTSPYSHHRIKHYLLDLREFMTSQRTYIRWKHVFLTYIHCKCSAIKLQDCPDTTSTKCQEEKKNIRQKWWNDAQQYPNCGVFCLENLH